MALIRSYYGKDGKLLSYKIVVTLGRDENGKKIYRSTTIKRPEGLTPKREEKEVARIADEWEREQREIYESNEARIRAEIRDEKKKLKVVGFIDNRWIEKHVKDGKHTPDTVGFYLNTANIVKEFFATEKPNLKIADVTVPDVLDFLYYMRNVAKKKDGEPYGDTTIQHCFSTLRNICEYAVYTEFLQENPCKKIKQSDRPRRTEREIDFLEEDDAIKFMECLESEKEAEYWENNGGSWLKWRTLVNMMIVTGLRRGELVGLQWRDIDKKNLIITVRRNVTLDKAAENKLHIGETKGKSIRKVPISKHTFAMLEELKKEYVEVFGSVGQSSYIFCRATDVNLPMYPTEPTRMMKKYITRHNLPNVSPHDLRHTAASLAIQSGANVKEVQKLLGHKDPSTTLKFYAGISEKTSRETVEGIEGLLRIKEKTEK